MQIDLSPLHNLGNGGLANTELKNGAHVILDCAKCNKKLCDIWITQPNLDVNSKVLAQCDYCGDRSFEKEIRGKFHIGITDDSTIVDINHDFIDGPNPTGIYQKMRVITKRSK